MGFCSRVVSTTTTTETTRSHMDILALLQPIKLSRHKNTKTPAGDAGGVKKPEGVAPWWLLVEDSNLEPSG